MPTKTQTQAFIRKHKEIKVKLSQRVGKMNMQVSDAVDKLDSQTHRDVINEWKFMMMKYDAPPKLSAAEFSEKVKSSPHGQKLLAQKKKPKAKITVSAKHFTKVSKLGKPLTGKASDFAKVKSVKKSTTIQKKSTAPTAPKKLKCYTKKGEKSGKVYTTCN
jgi:hypothetical protein